MAETLKDRIAHGWNAFMNRTEEPKLKWEQQTSYGRKPDQTRMFINTERSLLASIYVRMAIDISMVAQRHIRVDDEDRYINDIDSDLNYCLKFKPNLDQNPLLFKRDQVLTMFDRGVIGIVPVDTTLSPRDNNTYSIQNMRVGWILEFRPDDVLVDLYNEKKGIREQIWLPKKFVAIVENPLFPVMNQPNSTLQRLIRKLNLLDQLDEVTSSGKLDMIIQLPYTIRTETRREQARQRREEMELQLQGSKYGIAFADATEKITQLNRPVENNLLSEIEMLTNQLFFQLGVTKEIMDGTADEAAILNYQNRTVEPIVREINEAMQATFLTKTAITQGQRIDFFMDRFKLLPLSQLAEIADKFTRNEIMSGNELRQVLGLRPSKDPKADELRNSNMPRSDTELPSEDDGAVDAVFDDLDSTVDNMMSDLESSVDSEDEEGPEEENAVG